MPDNLFKSLLSIDIIGLYPPFDIALRIPGHPQPLSFSDALCAWRREHCGQSAGAVNGKQTADQGVVAEKNGGAAAAAKGGPARHGPKGFETR